MSRHPPAWSSGAGTSATPPVTPLCWSRTSHSSSRLLTPPATRIATNPGTTDERVATRNIFHGSADIGPAVEIHFALDPRLTVQNDPRPGRSPRWHKFIASTLTLTLLDADQVMRSVGGSNGFCLVRGDSANLEDGVTPDSTQWFLEHWEEQWPVGARTLPTKSSSLGGVKVLYR